MALKKSLVLNSGQPSEVPAGDAIAQRTAPRVTSITSSATPTINTDNVDMFEITALAVDITNMTTNLSGTPYEGQKLWISITGTGSRAINWGSAFANGASSLPSTTVGTNRIDIGFVWSSSASKWLCMAAPLPLQYGSLQCGYPPGSTILTGEMAPIVMPYDGEFASWTILGDATGSIVVDLLKTDYASYTPGGGSSICGSEKPTLSSASKNQDSSLSTWTLGFSQGDIITPVVESVSGLTGFSLSVEIVRS